MLCLSTETCLYFAVGYDDQIPKTAAFNQDTIFGPEFWPNSDGEGLEKGPRPAEGRPETDFEAFSIRIMPKPGTQVISLLKPGFLRVRSL